MAFLTRSLGGKFLRNISATNLNLNKQLSFSQVIRNEYKEELTAKQIANDNPFDSYVLKPESRGLFKSSPILIPSTKQSRMVGCCCEDDYQDIVWFELHKGNTQQCDCGNYFKLIDYDPLDPNVKPKYGMGFGSGLSSIYY